MADDDALDFDHENASALAEMLTSPMTSEAVRLQIINSLLEDDRDATFFETMFKEGMSLANCPFCDHENYFLVPEDDLNQFGWVSSESDPRVIVNPTKIDCPEYMEACKKKKTTA
jgi:hypothetical protein